MDAAQADSAAAQTSSSRSGPNEDFERYALAPHSAARGA